MSLDPKTIYNVQRSSDGAAWEEIYISGSNLVLHTDANGILTGSSLLPAEITASYALTASYVIGGGGGGGTNGTSGTSGANGTSGTSGGTGASGTDGTSGTDGASFDWEGGWSSFSTYLTGNVVFYEGNSIILDLNRKTTNNI